MKRITEILSQENITYLMMIFYFLQLIPMDILNDTIYLDVESLKSLKQTSPFIILFIAIIRIPMPILIYHIFYLLMDFKKDTPIIKAFRVISYLILIINIYFFFILPLITQYIVGVIQAEDNIALNLISIFQSFIGINQVIVASILIPIVEVFRFAMILIVLKQTKVIRSLSFYGLSSIVLTYEFICFLGSFLEMFDFLLFGIEPDVYNEYRSFMTALWLAGLMLYLFFKNFHQRRSIN